MKTSIRIVLSILALLLTVIPLSLYVRWSAKDRRYTQLITKYECLQDSCSADFDGDGRLGNLFKDRGSRPPSTFYSADKAWLVVNDSQRELLRIPYSYADNSLRTHAAIYQDANGTRLLVFDHTAEGKPIRQAFAWNGTQMVQVQPSIKDQDILAALNARDDAGSWNEWALFRALGKPVLIAYYLLLGAFGLIAIRHRKRTRKRAAQSARKIHVSHFD